MTLESNNIDHILNGNLATYDPYDLWATRFGLWLKRLYYRYGKITTPIVAPVTVLDTYAPQLARRLLRPKEYPIVRALAVLTALNLYELNSDDKYLEQSRDSVAWLMKNRCPGYHGACWGLNIPWMTKTGFLSASTPFITNTPYCVEALLKYADLTNDQQVRAVALSSLDFMENDLKVLLDGQDKLALSYGPGYESRIVINANSYAMMMYAMLAERMKEKRELLLDKATRIFNYIKSRQNSDGSWYYYDDKSRGNFIDCFHSCFILKNLIKYGRYSGVDVSPLVTKGLAYILDNLVDSKHFLARRFSISANPSLVKFDLYDQAELLNVLCMTDNKSAAVRLHDSILKNFYIPRKGTFGYQIDVFGRLNKMTYLRWAVMPMVYALSAYYRFMDDRNTAEQVA